MLRDGSRVLVEDMACEGAGVGSTGATTARRADWREADRKLRANARQRAALDADEAFWLREAERLRIWTPLGMVSMVDYLERVLGYGPRAGQDRLRVARALGALPVLTAALDQGALSYSAIKELVRVATPATERTWRDEAMGKNQRQIEELVAGHSPGDLPDDPVDPEVRMHMVRFEVSASTFAVVRQAQLALDEEHGRHLSEDEVLAAMAAAVLDRGGSGEPTGRAKWQIGMVECKGCQRAWQEGAGVRVPVDAATRERARCDAQWIGALDGDGPARATQDIPPSVVRFVWRRDEGRCQTPGCRSARNLELHHIVRRADGGTHDPRNLTLRCGSCHAAHHRGALTISGTAPDQLETRHTHNHAAPVHAPGAAAPAHGGAAAPAHGGATAPAHGDATAPAHGGAAAPAHGGAAAPAHGGAAAPAHGGAAAHADRGAAAHADRGAASPTHGGAAAPAHGGVGRLDAAVLRAQAKDALVGLGWKPGIARIAVEEASAQVGRDPTIAALIREALRRCPRPTS